LIVHPDRNIDPLSVDVKQTANYFSGRSMSFEILDFLLVLFCRFFIAESAQIAALLRLRVDFTGVKPVFPGF
jgi:hypothetical protein